MKKQMLKAAVLALSMVGIIKPGTVAASGFALFEQNASGAGNAFAGSAAVAEDASTTYFNPAGLTYIKGSQFIVGGHGIYVDAKFSTQSATSGAGTPMTGGNGGNAGGWVLVPNLYYSMKLSPQLTFGVGVNVPFGLTTDYDVNWVGRYQALKSDVKTVNINPSLAWKVNDTVSLGAGISAQYITAELSKAIDFGTVCFGVLPAGACVGLGLTPQNSDGSVKIEGDDWGYGFNLGALFQVTPDTRIGVAYRSKVTEELSGTAKYSSVPAAFAAQPSFADTGVRASIVLPESISISSFTQLDPKWAIMTDVTWTRWSRFNELRIRFDNGAADNVTPEEWKDSYRISVGANYQLNNAWKLRGGIAYDRTPVKEEFRTARIPDNDRTWIAIGATCRLGTADVVDFAYAHGFIKDARLNKSEPPVGGTVVGEYDTKAEVLSAQYTHSF